MAGKQPLGKINIRAAPPEAGAPRRPPPRRPAPRTYSGYLEDHPILIPVVTLVLGSLFLYSTIFSSLLQDLMLGRGAGRGNATAFNNMTSWLVAFTIAIMFLSTIFLGIHGLTVAARYRRPVVCPGCGLAEPAPGPRFARRVVEGTGWDQVTCRGCGHSWHVRA